MAGILGAIAAAAFGAIAYGVAEARMHRINRYEFPILPKGARPITILQVSDLHLRLTTKRLIAFLRSLDSDEYDVVLATGDLLGSPEAMPLCTTLLNRLRGRVGRYFVFGSSDYYAPKFKNYLDYFLKRRRVSTRRNPTERFRDGLKREGWIEMTNRTLIGDFNGTTLQLTGLDDPYLHRDDRSLLRRETQTQVAICVVHDPAPYDEALAAGFDLVVAGHTHGGQVRIPFIGAVVTNSTLPTSLAKGAHKIDDGWLFVSPGLGTGKYAPFRFLSPPEASVLELVARS